MTKKPILFPDPSALSFLIGRQIEWSRLFQKDDGTLGTCSYSGSIIAIDFVNTLVQIADESASHPYVLLHKQHILCIGKNREKNAWIRELRSEDLEPLLFIKEKVAGKRTAEKREGYWIRHYLERDMPLANLYIEGR